LDIETKEVMMLSNGLNGNNTLPQNASDGSRYYFSRLTDEQKTVYKSLFSGIRTFTREIKMPIRPVNEMSMIFNYVLLDNPLIFYVGAYSQSSDLFRKKCSIAPNYKYTRQTAKENATAVKKYLQAFEPAMEKSDLEKEIFVHDYCLNNFCYDYTFGDYSFSVLGPVFNKTAVCEGIAKFVKLALDYLGVKSLVVSGKAKNPAQESSMEGHAWNIVRIDGKLYHLDVTFDMTIKNKVNRYDYFNLSDEEIKKDHIIIDNVPACTTVGNDYYSVNSLSVNGIAELDNYIGKALKQGKKSILVKIMNARYTNEVANQISEIAGQQYSRIHMGGVSIETSYNASQMVFEISFR
jgi:hypothetical protein